MVISYKQGKEAKQRKIDEMLLNEKICREKARKKTQKTIERLLDQKISNGEINDIIKGKMEVHIRMSFEQYAKSCMEKNPLAEPPWIRSYGVKNLKEEVFDPLQEKYKKAGWSELYHFWTPEFSKEYLHIFLLKQLRSR